MGALAALASSTMKSLRHGLVIMSLLQPIVDICVQGELVTKRFKQIEVIVPHLSRATVGFGSKPFFFATK